MIRILTGDALAMLRTLESESVQVCVTSPPYFALRDYGVVGQIGLESTPAEFVAKLVAVFDEVKRVLRRDGLVFCNLGDSYAGSGKGPTGKSGIGDQEQRQGFDGNPSRRRGQPFLPNGVKAKSLLLIPERFAIAMQDAGWYVRSRIAWCKKSAMPESVRDRPTSAWEHIWMFSRERTYYYDAEAVRTDYVKHWANCNSNGKTLAPGSDYTLKTGQPGGGIRSTKRIEEGTGANLRNFWLLGPEPYNAAHFATFPPEIPRRCILAGSRPGDVVLDPFAGAGTTLLVASRLGRDGVGIELNPTYAAMARQRVFDDCPMFSDVETA